MLHTVQDNVPSNVAHQCDTRTVNIMQQHASKLECRIMSRVLVAALVSSTRYWSSVGHAQHFPRPRAIPPDGSSVEKSIFSSNHSRSKTQPRKQHTHLRPAPCSRPAHSHAVQGEHFVAAAGNAAARLCRACTELSAFFPRQVSQQIRRTLTWQREGCSQRVPVVRVPLQTH